MFDLRASGCLVLDNYFLMITPSEVSVRLSIEKSTEVDEKPTAVARKRIINQLTEERERLDKLGPD